MTISGVWIPDVDGIQNRPFVYRLFIGAISFFFSPLTYVQGFHMMLLLYGVDVSLGTFPRHIKPSKTEGWLDEGA